MLVTDVEATCVRLAEAEAAIDAELAALESERAADVVDTPAAVLAEYEQLKGLGGVAVAKLEADRANGCHLHLSALELDRIKKLPPDEIVTAEEVAASSCADRAAGPVMFVQPAAAAFLIVALVFSSPASTTGSCSAPSSRWRKGHSAGPISSTPCSAAWRCSVWWSW